MSRNKLFVLMCAAILATGCGRREGFGQIAQTFVRNHFPDALVVSVHQDDYWDDYEVALNNGVEISFDHDDKWVDIDGGNLPLPRSVVKLLPASVYKALRKFYPGVDVLEISREKYGYEVDLVGDIEVEFTNNGKIRKVSN